jgi:trehalose synthase
VKAEWEVIKGDPDFFAVTKAFHNALQGYDQVFTDALLQHYLEINRSNAERLDLSGDLVLIHDPQPAALIERRPAEGRWVWRCHIDLSTPQRRAWSFLRRHVLRYDAAIFSLPAFAQQLPIPQFLVYPSIDPLADKNRAMEPAEVSRLLEPLGIPADRPLIVQVSRFDRFKDPVGVIAAYRMLKRYHDAVLVLAGGGADDDPEGARVLADVREARRRTATSISSTFPPTRISRSTRSSTPPPSCSRSPPGRASGSPWRRRCGKGKPVIGGATGGIIAQIIPGVTGYAVSSVEGAAHWMRHLLAHPEAAARMGEAGREHVRQNFLITRQLREYLSIMVHLTA